MYMNLAQEAMPDRLFYRVKKAKHAMLAMKRQATQPRVSSTSNHLKKEIKRSTIHIYAIY